MSLTLPCAISAQNSQPLTESEKRLILGQLGELRTCRQTVVTYEDYIRRDREQDARELELSKRALEVEKRQVSIAEQERDLFKVQAEFYMNAFKAVTRKPSFWCRLKRIFSFGIARCR